MKEAESLNRMDEVDRTSDPEQFVHYLDRVSALESTRTFKRHTFALMDARLGSHLLDAGCGTGEDVRAMGQLVGPGGRVVGVDSSETMIAEARKRSEGRAEPVEFYRGSLYRLDFADNTFDGCRADRVFMHLDEPRKALAELQRVVKPGGIVVIDDPDWETMVVDTLERELTRKIWQFAVDSVVNGWMGRQLAGLFKSQGFNDIDIEPITLVATDFEDAMQSWGFRMHAARASEAGVVTADEAARWLGDLEKRSEDDRFFAALTGFTVRGRKP